MDRYDFAEFLLLQERYYEHQDYWPARAEALMCNINRDPDKTGAYDFRDFMRGRKPEEPKEEQLVNPNLNDKLDALAAFFNKKANVAGGAS